MFLRTMRIVLLSALMLITAAPQVVLGDTSGVSHLFVANAGANSITVIAPGQNVVLGTVAVGQEPHQIIAVPSTGNIYVGNFGENTVSVVDPREMKEVTRITVG